MKNFRVQAFRSAHQVATERPADHNQAMASAITTQMTITMNVRVQMAPFKLIAARIAKSAKMDFLAAATARACQMGTVCAPMAGSEWLVIREASLLSAPSSLCSTRTRFNKL